MAAPRKPAARKKAVAKRAARKNARSDALATLPQARDKPRQTRRQDGKRANEKFVFDERQLRALCRIHSTDEEMAAVLGCSVSLIEKRRAKDPWFQEIERTERQLGRASHRRDLHLLAGKANKPGAPKGAITALIFIAKQPPDRGGLGMADRVQNEVTLPQLDPTNAKAMLNQRLIALSRKKKARPKTEK